MVGVGGAGVHRHGSGGQGFPHLHWQHPNQTRIELLTFGQCREPH